MEIDAKLSYSLTEVKKLVCIYVGGLYSLVGGWVSAGVRPQEEKLEGDNRYFCESCQSKQNAARRITLQSLPRTLNLQLMRFVFDR